MASTKQLTEDVDKYIERAKIHADAASKFASLPILNLEQAALAAKQAEGHAYAAMAAAAVVDAVTDRLSITEDLEFDRV